MSAHRSPITGPQSGSSLWSAEDALPRAEALCAQRRVRLTPLRRWVLENLWRDRRPMGAYQLLDALKREKGKAAPPTVYRALDFLMSQGLIHKLGSQNAFIACNRPEAPHVTRFFLCKSCGSAIEMEAVVIDDALANAAKLAQFDMEQGLVEVIGICRLCSADPSRGGIPWMNELKARDRW